MTRVTDAQLKKLVDGLSRWDGARHIGAPEVLAWRTGRKGAYGVVRVAFRGDPARMKRNLFSGMRNPTMRGSYVGLLDLDLWRSLGIDSSGQLFPSGDIHPYDFVDGVHVASDAFLEQLGVEDAGELVEVTLMPKEGEPWVLGQKATTYVSSRKARPIKRTKAPEGIVELDMDESELRNADMDVPLGIDPCVAAERIEQCFRGGVVGRLPVRGHALDFIVTHSFDVTMPRFTDAAQRIADCGGLAYPSLAVGEIAASNFGQVALIADVGLVLAALKPYRGRGRFPVVLYRTDAWTARTRYIMTVGAHELLVELTGQPTNWTYKQDWWVLGPPVEEHKADLVTNTKGLRKELKERYRIWPRQLDAAQIEQIMERMLAQEGVGHMIEAGKYPYLEAKVNGVVPLSCFPLAVCPKGLQTKAVKFLKTAGWQGVLATVDFPVYDGDADWVRDGRDLRYDYGWEVRDVVEDFAADNDQVLHVRV